MNNEKKRILVVDDEPSITRLLKLNLEQTGDYEVATENSPKAAVAAAEEFQPELLLLDVVMPGRLQDGPAGFGCHRLAVDEEVDHVVRRIFAGTHRLTS